MEDIIKFSSPDQFLKRAFKQFPQAREAMMNAQGISSKLLPYQAAMLYGLVLPYNRPGVSILEIGTFAGHSAAIMAQAAPLAQIVTLNPVKHEHGEAIINLAKFRNIHPVNEASWNFLVQTPDDYQPDVVFIDGDHKNIGLDLPLWDRLNTGGLMLFHDYSPPLAKNPCPPVYDAVNTLSEALGRGKPDVCIIDTDLIGMAGFYKGVDDVKLLYS